MNEDASKPTSATDWARVSALADAEIDTSDIPPLSEEFFAQAALRFPRERELVEVTLHLDPQVLEWFRRQGSEYERAINSALRIYAEAHSQYRARRAR